MMHPDDRRWLEALKEATARGENLSRDKKRVFRLLMRLEEKSEECVRLRKLLEKIYVVAREYPNL
jgi:hypothetical protein